MCKVVLPGENITVEGFFFSSCNENMHRHSSRSSRSLSWWEPLLSFFSFSLVTLVSCLQTSPEVVDLVQWIPASLVLSNTSVNNLSYRAFQQSRCSTIFNSLKKLPTDKLYRPRNSFGFATAVFLCLLEAWAEGNNPNKCFNMVNIFLLIRISKGLHHPSRSDWRCVQIRSDPISLRHFIWAFILVISGILRLLCKHCW